MSSPAASRFSSPEDDAPMDEYQELRERIEELPFSRDQTEPDTTVLDNHIDFGNAEYRRQRVDEIAMAQLLLGELHRAEVEIGDLINLLCLLRSSLYNGESIDRIIGAYLNILADLEVIERLTRLVEEVIWIYVFRPITQCGAANRNDNRAMTGDAEAGSRLTYSISSQQDSQNSSTQALTPPSQSTSRRREQSSLANLHRRIACLRSIENSGRNKGKTAGQIPLGISKRGSKSRSKQASINRRRVYLQSSLSRTTNVDDPQNSLSNDSNKSSDQGRASSSTKPASFMTHEVVK